MYFPTLLLHTQKKHDIDNNKYSKKKRTIVIPLKQFNIVFNADLILMEFTFKKKGKVYLINNKIVKKA